MAWRHLSLQTTKRSEPSDKILGPLAHNVTTPTHELNIFLFLHYKLALCHVFTLHSGRPTDYIREI